MKYITKIEKIQTQTHTERQTDMQADKLRLLHISNRNKDEIKQKSHISTKPDPPQLHEKTIAMTTKAEKSRVATED